MTIPFRAATSTKEIVFVRHAESQANRDGIWNGRMDGPLSEAGEESLEALGQRLSRQHFDVVVSSSLTRARRTAEAFADAVIVDDEFVEIDLGKWEGMPFDDVRSKYGEELREAVSTGTLPMGGTGETLEQARKRALSAVDRLFEALNDGERAAVVTHGGFLQAVIRRHLKGDARRVHAFTQNTAITRIVRQFDRYRLASFNDVGHLGSGSKPVRQHLDEGTPVLALVRHGRTRANVERRWQGHGDWDLDEFGFRQAEALRGWYGTKETVYSSPLKRAISTARHIASNGVVPVTGLEEIEMGEWEGLTTEQIIEGWPAVMERIYKHGVDLRRGITGESWGELTVRFTKALDGVEKAPGAPTVVVAHGGAIRSYVSSITDTEETYGESLFTPSNTSVTHVALTKAGPEILDYGVAPHLETLQ
ncbi:MAG: histidine phosphatase family protein [Acidimicrobiia bacterium]|nr:histidine phosphatase family protein [Acidimicrobiia bacterium]